MRSKHKRWWATALLCGSLSLPAHAGAALDAVKAYMDGWNAHDANQAAMAMDPDVEYYDVTVGESQYGVVVARDNVIRFFLNSFPDLKWEMQGEPVEKGEQIAFRWRFSGTNTGPNIDATIDGGKPTSKAISFDGVSLMQVKSGKIVYQGDFYDALSLNKQLGNVR